MARSTEETPRTRRRTRRAEAPQTLAHDEIARRAHELFLQEGAAHGRDLGHWLEAEQQLLDEAMRRAPR